MKTRRKALCFLSVFLAAGVCAAADSAHDRLVGALMRASGLVRQIEQIPLLVQAGLAQEQEKSHALAPQAFDFVKDTANASFDEKAIKARVAAHVGSALSDEEMRKVLAWLESPLGRRITKMEEDASTPEAVAEVQSVGRVMADKYKGTSRVAKMSRLDRATMASERSLDLLLDIQVAMLTAMSGAAAGQDEPSYEEIRQAVNETRGKIRGAVTQGVAVQFLYSYRSLTEAELDRYIRFAESSVGRRYHRVTYEAVHDAVLQSVRTMGKRLGMKMKKV
jgi:Uncharacterized protein conserved in bacteria (DUF2059)